MTDLHRPDLPTPICDGCGQPVQIEPRTFYARRGDRVLTVPSWTWTCSTCADPFTGERPYNFADHALMQWHEAEVARLWLERFGEPLPPSERGKRVGPRRSIRVPVLLTEEEAKQLDDQRGDQSRGEFLRQAIRRAS